MANVINAPTAGIYRKEIDNSNNVAVAGTSAGAIVVRASMGPVNREVIVADYPTYTNIFGTPTFSAGTDVPVYGYGAYAAEEFLKESAELHVLRIFDAADNYPMIRFLSTFSTSSTASNMSGLSDEGVSGTMTPANPDTVSTIYALDQAINPTDHLMIGALGPGIADENIGVTIQTFTPSADWLLNYDDYPSFSAISSVLNSAANYPTTTGFNAALTAIGTQYAVSALFPVALQVVKINVYSKNSNQNWSDINSQIGSTIKISDLVPVETWYGTLGFQLDAKKNQLRIKEIVNGNSQYIYCVVGAGTFPNDVSPSTTKIFGLGGGAISPNNGYAGYNNVGDSSNIIQGWEFFRSREYATVNILNNPDDNMAVKQEVDNIAATRMDCISTGQSGNVNAVTVSQVINEETYGYTNPSYIALYAGWDKKYDSANDRNIFVPKALYGAALMARNDRTGNTWDAPAGDPNGILSSSGQNHVFNFTDIGLLAKSGINTSRFLRSTGHTMWSQRTAQIKDTALTRINVRRLLLYIENSIELTLFPFLFNIVNDDKQRLRVSTLFNDFLGGVQSGGGVTAALAVCSDKNNPSVVIDAEQMIVDVFVTPAKKVEVIQLNTRITNSGVSFTEILL
jgi:hypothetical protein